MRMIFAALVVSFLAFPAAAQNYGVPYDQRQPPPRSSDFGYGASQPRPAAGPYDHPTLGSPEPRVYGRTPTLGDPRPYRNTNPRTCTGLLCN